MTIILFLAITEIMEYFYSKHYEYLIKTYAEVKQV